MPVRCLPCRVEALGGDLMDKLIRLYEQLYFAPRVSPLCVCVCLFHSGGFLVSFPSPILYTQGFSGMGDWDETKLCVCTCISIAIAIFFVLFLKQREYDATNVVLRLTKNFTTLRRDFGEFLSLKGVLNMPMIRYPLS